MIRAAKAVFSKLALTKKYSLLEQIKKG